MRQENDVLIALAGHESADLDLAFAKPDAFRNAEFTAFGRWQVSVPTMVARFPYWNWDHQAQLSRFLK